MDPAVFAFLIGVLPGYIQPWLTVVLQALLCILLVLLIRIAWSMLHTK